MSLFRRKRLLKPARTGTRKARWMRNQFPGHEMQRIRNDRKSNFRPAVDAVTEDELSWEFLTPVGQEFRIRDFQLPSGEDIARSDAAIAKLLEELG